jgi:hypothetical protein
MPGGSRRDCWTDKPIHPLSASTGVAEQSDVRIAPVIAISHEGTLAQRDGKA